MKQHFNEIVELSMKVMEKSEAGFRWIGQLHKIIPQQMITHLLVASELLMGAINGTVHIVKDNLQVLISLEKRENYTKRLYNLHQVYKNRHQKILEDLGQQSEAE
jgi:formiminotetrahydrofolate cyclodeaminase